MKASQPNREFAIVGLGRFGSSLARELSALGCTVLAVDLNRKKVQELSTDLEQLLILDATDEEALRASGVAEFETVIVCIGADFEANILATSLLKELGCRRLICKALSPRQRSILLKTGADMVVLPEFEAGLRLAHQLVEPIHTVDRTDLPPGLALGEVLCPASWQGKQLRDLHARQELGLFILRIHGGRSVLMPAPEETLQSGDELLVIGRESSIRRLLEGQV